MSEKRPRILFAMIEVGHGHKGPAMAMSEAFTELRSEAQVEVVDLASASGAHAADRRFKEAWDVMLDHPIVARLGYLAVEAAHFMKKAYLRPIFGDFVPKGIEFIRRFDPDMVVSTHPHCTYIAAKARKALKRDFKLVSCVVDPFDGYSWWADGDVDRYIVASDIAARGLVRHGAVAGKIVKLGYPIRKAFTAPADPGRLERLREELGLDPMLKTVLVTSGAQGAGNAYSWIGEFAAESVPCNIVTVAGRNAETKAAMDALASGRSAPHVVSIGFADNMGDLMSIADLVVGKAGASTAMEAIFLGKPVLFTEWATYNDKAIIDFFLEEGIGFHAGSRKAFVAILLDILRNDALSPAAERLAGLGMKPGTDAIARFLLEFLESSGRAATVPSPVTERNSNGR